MKYFNEIRENIAEEMPRWLLIVLGAAVAVFLAMTIETGRAHAAGTDFSFKGYLSKFVTPNGDALNPRAILCVDNPKDLAVRGRVFDLRGHHVADMTHIVDTTGVDPLKPIVSCKAAFGTPFKMQSVVWDGRSQGGEAVVSGVYVWRIEAEQSAVTGTVVVAR